MTIHFPCSSFFIPMDGSRYVLFGRIPFMLRHFYINRLVCFEEKERRVYHDRIPFFVSCHMLTVSILWRIAYRCIVISLYVTLIYATNAVNTRNPLKIYVRGSQSNIYTHTSLYVCIISKCTHSIYIYIHTYIFISHVALYKSNENLPHHGMARFFRLNIVDLIMKFAREGNSAIWMYCMNQPSI